MKRILLYKYPDEWRPYLRQEASLWEGLDVLVTMSNVRTGTYDIVLPFARGSRAASILANKYRFEQAMNEFWPRAYPFFDGSFPAVLKRVDCSGGYGVIYLLGEKTLAFQTHDVWKGQRTVLQKFVSGPEYVSHLLCDRGHVLWSRTLVYTDGPLDAILTTERRAFYRTRPIAFFDARVFETILVPLRLNGLCCVNFKIEDGEPQIFEINPRLGGSLLFHTSDLREMMRILVGL